MEFELEESLVEEQWRPTTPAQRTRSRPSRARPSQWGVWIPEECAPEDEPDMRSGLVAVA